MDAQNKTDRGQAQKSPRANKDKNNSIQKVAPEGENGKNQLNKKASGTLWRKWMSGIINREQYNIKRYGMSKKEFRANMQKDEYMEGFKQR